MSKPKDEQPGVGFGVGISLDDEGAPEVEEITPPALVDVTLRLDAEMLAALDLWVADRAQGLSRADAAVDALRDWMIGHRYLKAPPDDPEMAN